MIIKSHIRFKEYLNLMYRLTYRKPVMIGLVTFDLLMIFWVILYYIGFDFLPEPQYPQYMAIGLISVAQPIGIYLTIRQNYKSSSKLHETATIEFTKEKISMRGKSFYIEYAWNKTFRVLELRDWLLIYENTFAAIIIPRRLMTKHEISEFMDFAQTLTHTRIKTRKRPGRHA
jgi:hypothetical protein